MRQPEQNQLEALEQAIRSRAEELAQETIDKANRKRDVILRDAAERLQMAEEREVLITKAEAERHFHRVTQASELKMQSRLDQLRWELVQAVQAQLAQRMQALCDDRKAYRKWLLQMVHDAAAVLPGNLIRKISCASANYSMSTRSSFSWTMKSRRLT